MLAKQIRAPFSDPKWIFEIKYDGFRALAKIEKGNVDLYSRNGLCFNEKFPNIIEDLKKIKNSLLLDGEIVVLNEEGIPDFQRIQNFIPHHESALYMVFDLLYFDNHNLMQLPLIERKKTLEKILPNLPNVIYLDHIDSQGEVFFEEIKKLGLEGIIAKKKSSPYVERRSPDWLKIKFIQQRHSIIYGYTAPRPGRHFFSALCLGSYEEKKLISIGKVGAGFKESELGEIYHSLKQLKVREKKINGEVTHLTAPFYSCKVGYYEKTKEGKLRQPIFLDDFKPIYSHLDKAFWPKEGLTKRDLLLYYFKIASILLPHLKDRAQVLHRFPEGIEGESFFQKNADSLPEYIQKHRKFALIQDERSLLAIANLGCIELHSFSARIQQQNYPDYLVIDLDPVEISFDQAIHTALIFKELFDKLAITAYPKTSGLRGMHLYLPIKIKYEFAWVRDFAEVLCRLVQERIPDIVSLERDPKKRKRKVYLDFLQNRKDTSMVAPYSVRPIAGAFVSAPLEWKEIKKGLRPSQFTMKNMEKRIEEKGDLFKEVLSQENDLSYAVKKI